MKKAKKKKKRKIKILTQIIRISACRQKESSLTKLKYVLTHSTFFDYPFFFFSISHVTVPFHFFQFLTSSLSSSSSSPPLLPTPLFLLYLQELLTSVSRESWNEFVRCLDLFSCDAVSKKDLFALVQVILLQYDELWCDVMSCDVM